MPQHLIDHQPKTKTVQDLINLNEDNHLNLEPGFQRQSVWQERDRSKLIDSILRNHNPFSRGGRTQLENAALMCRSCNASKGRRRH